MGSLFDGSPPRGVGHMKKGSFLIAAMMQYIGSLNTIYTLPNSLGRGNQVGFFASSSTLFGSILAGILGGRLCVDVTLVLTGLLPRGHIIEFVT